MCEELSACAVMTDGAGSLFQREVIKSQIMTAGEGQGSVGGGSKDREERIGPDPSNDKGNQSIWEHFRPRKVLFPPSAVWSQGSVRGQEYDL